MIRLQPIVSSDRPVRLLCIGAHSDDLEIGCGGTLLSWIKAMPAVEVTWVVLAGSSGRMAEARKSARALLRGAVKVHLVFGSFQDGYLPSLYSQVKTFFEELKRVENPDIIFTHCLQERHQDHKLAAELTWNTWRDHLIYEYEIPKYEGSLPQPNAYVPLTAQLAHRKVAHLMRFFSSQRSKDWFRGDVFQAQMLIRGIECRAPSGCAEAFHARKIIL
jgi:LmbE family N-acetylglucosaminyl deacetylase